MNAYCANLSCTHPHTHNEKKRKTTESHKKSQRNRDRHHHLLATYAKSTISRKNIISYRIIIRYVVHKTTDRQKEGRTIIANLQSYQWDWNRSLYCLMTEVRSYFLLLHHVCCSSSHSSASMRSEPCLSPIHARTYISISISIYLVQKYNNTGNSNDTWTGQLGIYRALTVVHSKRTVIKFTYT